MPPADVNLIRESVAMAPMTTLRVGGAARWFARATDPGHIESVFSWAAGRCPVQVIGGGSNLVVADTGFDGLVLQIALQGTTFEREGEDTLVSAQAGEPWDGLVAATVERGLAGLECLSGIPGSVGGTPIQNVGAYGQEVATSIDSVTVFDRAAGATHVLPGADCGFAYRASRFKRDDAGRFVVCGVTFRLRQGAPTVEYKDVSAYIERMGIASPGVADVRAAVLAIRRQKGMVLDEADPDTRSVGSFFMNPVVGAPLHERVSAIAGRAVPGYPAGGGAMKIPAAWLIEAADFERGHTRGQAAISSKHTLALVNRGAATARDIVRLAIEIKRRVHDRFGVTLQPEPIFVGFGDDSDVDYLLKAHD